MILNTLFYGLTFDRAVLLLDLDDPGRARLPGGLQGHARLVQALLPEVVGAALGASPALRSCIRAALRISRLSIIDIHILTSLSRPRWCTFCESVGCRQHAHSMREGGSFASLLNVVHAFTLRTTQLCIA